jgi:hypothetical protein
MVLRELSGREGGIEHLMLVQWQVGGTPKVIKLPWQTVGRQIGIKK